MRHYRIKNWSEHFENNKSKERDRCSWCPIPNKQDGLGYGRLLCMTDGAALYGAFVAVVLVASKQKRPRNGHLTDTGLTDGCPLTASDLSIKTKVESNIIQSMLDACCSEQIGWIELLGSETPNSKGIRQLPIECPRSAIEVPADCLGREGNGIEGNGNEVKGTPIVPKGDGDSQLPIWFPTAEQKRLSKIFNRRETTKFSDKEQKAYKKILPINDEDLACVERYYGAVIPDDKNVRRHDLMTLLNNWNGEVDRARAYIKANPTHEECPDF